LVIVAMAGSTTIVGRAWAMAVAEMAAKATAAAIAVILLRGI
jgi:hypothetical protein